MESPVHLCGDWWLRMARTLGFVDAGITLRNDPHGSASCTGSSRNTQVAAILAHYSRCVSVCLFLVFLPDLAAVVFMVSRRFSPTRMGTFTAIPLILMAATSLLGGSLGDRLIAAGRDPVRVRAVLTAGGFLAGTSIALVPIFQSDLLAIATLCVSLSGVGIAAANYWAVTQTLLPRQFIGRAIGFQNMVANIGGASVPVVSGFLIGPSNDFFLPILFSAVSILIAAGAYLVLAGRSAALATAPTPSRAHGAH